MVVVRSAQPLSLDEGGRHEVAAASPTANRDFLGAGSLGKTTWSHGGGSKIPSAPEGFGRLGIGVAAVSGPQQALGESMGWGSWRAGGAAS